MNIDITFRDSNKESHASTREFLEQLVDRHLRPHVTAFNPNHLKLHVTVEQRKNTYHVTCRLHLPPRKVLVARASGEHLRTVFQQVLEELSRRLNDTGRASEAENSGNAKADTSAYNS